MFCSHFLLFTRTPRSPLFCNAPSPPPSQECVTLQPSMLDFMQRRGRVLKKMGALTMAAGAVDSARELDKADRYMNSKVPFRSCLVVSVRDFAVSLLPCCVAPGAVSLLPSCAVPLVCLIPRPLCRIAVSGLCGVTIVVLCLLCCLFVPCCLHPSRSTFLLYCVFGVVDGFAVVGVMLFLLLSLEVLMLGCCRWWWWWL